jgi:1-acyl-sn-glycerol-3-phosphate acyltransferase
MRKAIPLKDKKNWLTYSFWSRINHLAVHTHFKKVVVIGGENIPQRGAFMLVSNHISRWDGLLAYSLVGRPANFMVSPNELLGPQGVVLKSMGSFPADPRHDLNGHVERQAQKGEGIVIFPEGDVYRDGTTHPFKAGAARFSLAMSSKGIDVPLIPMAIHYRDDGDTAVVMVSPAVDTACYRTEFEANPAAAVKTLSERLHREVCHLKHSLGSQADSQTLFIGRPPRSWAPSVKAS